jgi:hypothetical protein
MNIKQQSGGVYTAAESKPFLKIKWNKSKGFIPFLFGFIHVYSKNIIKYKQI